VRNKEQRLRDQEGGNEEDRRAEKGKEDKEVERRGEESPRFFVLTHAREKRAGLHIKPGECPCSYDE
jgi:hypothetical protein